MTVFEAERYIKTALDGIESAGFEARQLARHLEKEGVCDKETADALVARRKKGEPLQYILGEWEFYSLPFLCGEGVLIPRADTETLCDKAIEFIGDRECDCIDLCSGSGCVAITVAEHCKNARVWALEKYDEAFAFLEKNIALNRSRTKAIKADLFTYEGGKYDLIVSNPPYIKSDVMESLQAEVKREPKTALDGGEDGLLFYRAIVEKWVPHLKKGGMLAVEIGYDQADAVKELFTAAGLENIGSCCDLGGIERVIFGTLINI